MARLRLSESLSISQALEDRQTIASVLCSLAKVAQHQNDYTLARSLVDKSLATWRELGLPVAGVAAALNTLGELAQEGGEYRLAHSAYKESLAILRKIGTRRLVADALQGSARLASIQRQPVRAFRLAAAALQLREVTGAPYTPAERSAFERRLASICPELSLDLAAAAWAEGQCMSLEQAMSYACAQDAGERARR
jgi:tetratricopeptide (TPR) repeat protein